MVLHKKLIVRLYLMLWLFSIIGIYLTLSWWTYPITEVSKPECKKYTWAEMWDDCKMPLPKIDINDLKTYAKDENNLFIYSDLWWGSYSDWRNTASGSSPWIDIATSSWTPVYSIWDGEVVIAKNRWEFGNTITIKHPYNWWYIYSSYSHLSELDVSVWDTVKEWQLIWKVGKTWYVRWQYGNHLDFEITTKTDKNNYYPYSFNDCKMWEYHTIIENGSCRDKIFEYTADPIVFLNTNGEMLYNEENTPSKYNEYATSHAVASQVSKQNVAKNEYTLTVPKTTTVAKKETTVTKTPDVKLATNTKPTATTKNTTAKTTTSTKTTTTTKNTSSQTKLAINDIKKNDTAKLWKVYKFTIQTDKKQMENLKIAEEDWLLKIGKNTNKEKTTADVYIKPIKKWTTTIKIMDGKKLIASYNLKIT